MVLLGLVLPLAVILIVLLVLLVVLLIVAMILIAVLLLHRVCSFLCIRGLDRKRSLREKRDLIQSNINLCLIAPRMLPSKVLKITAKSKEAQKSNAQKNSRKRNHLLAGSTFI